LKGEEMSGFFETMHLKEMAEEDIWFARRDRELKEAIRRRKELARQRDAQENPAEGKVKD
jgi:hypothetical protein